MPVLEILSTLILYPLQLFLELVFAVSCRLLSSEGLAVVCVSLAVNLLMLPVYNKADSLRDRVLAKQQAMQRGVSHIKKTFSGDERFLMLSEYYAQNRYSPLYSLLSSLSILLQLPFFMAAYSYLAHLPSLHNKGFLFITDLGARDAILTFPHAALNLLPIVMTVVNCISGALYTRGHSVREKVQVYLLAGIFLVLLYNAPSGLVLYWTCNNLFSLFKNIWSARKIASARKTALVQKPASAQKSVRRRAPLLPHGWSGALFSGESRKMTGIFAWSCLLLCLLHGLALPTALLASSTAEFSAVMEYANPIRYALITFLQAAGLFVLWPLCLYFLFGGHTRIQGCLSFASAALACCSLVNAYAFPGNYGDISASLCFLNEVDFRIVSVFSLGNLLVLAAVVLAVFFLCRQGREHVFLWGLRVLLLALVSFSLWNGIRIQRAYTAYRPSVDRSRVERVEPIFTLSRNHPNVVLIMLDRAQSQYLSELFREAPELKDAFSGFTAYENTVSFNAHTLAGMPPIFGGYEYSPVEINRRPEETLAEKNNQAQLLLPLVLQNALGFSSVIADPQYGNYSLYCDTSFIDPYAPAIRGCQTKEVYSPFWYRDNNSGGLSDPRTDSLKRNILFFSFFRSFPVCMRKAVYKGGEYWSTSSFSTMKEFIDSYAVLDYMQELTAVSDTDSGCYMSLVNESTHCSQFLQAPDYIPVDEVTDRGTSLYRDWDAYAPQMAAFKKLAAWFDYLRTEGVYANTRIIIVSDHGCRGIEAELEADRALDRRIGGGDYWGRGHYHPLLMFKDFGDGTPFVQDRETFMTNGDVPSLLLNGLVEQPVNPFTGKPIPTDTRPLKADGVIISASDAHRPADNGSCRYSIRDGEWWLVRDSVFKASSWTQIEAPEGTK
ncbi:MAG: membrane protein insertase YidC [Treponema sp.]|nr:membrane protein insertase YidC [Treponema sp.]